MPVVAVPGTAIDVQSRMSEFSSATQASSAFATLQSPKSTTVTIGIRSIWPTSVCEPFNGVSDERGVAMSAAAQMFSTLRAAAA